MTVWASPRCGVRAAALAAMTVLLPAGQATAQNAPEMTRCDPAPLGNPLTGPMWNGWGADLANTRFQPASVAGLSAADVPKLALKWAFGFPAGEHVASQPTVVGGRIYIGTGPGGVYSIDAATGCLHWAFRAHAIVRTAISIGQVEVLGHRVYAAFFGDLQANVYAVDAANGRHLWTRRVDMHPSARITGAPTLYEGRLFVPVSSLEEAVAANPAYECCTFRGSVVAMEAATGEPVWRTYTIDETPVPTKKNANGVQNWGPAGAAVWNAPTVDPKRGLLYLATGDAYTAPASPNSDAVIAVDLKTGKKVWVTQVTKDDAWISGCERETNRPINCPDEPGPDFDFGQSVILRDLPDGRSILTVGQKSGVGWAFDPDNKGAVLWEYTVGRGSIRGGMQFGSAADERVVYFATSDYPEGPEAGGLAAVDMATGKPVWHVRPPRMTCEQANDPTCIQAQSQAVTAIPGVVFSGATNGMMRAYSSADGKIIWEFDTAREFETVNGPPARGGSIDGPGATIVGGVMYLNSGYALTRGGVPGNVMLAFAPAR
ncbi:MAG: hypothetical protein FJW23_16385 [Acidimicrobiia bacterium]|nr:hypothetical protein [Acidimicrobiia bacterium]